MSPIASYRRLFALAGPAYVAIAFVGRLPLAMSQLGTLLMVSTATGSYGAGGAAAGALAVANAIGAPVAAALTDRIGQRPVVLVQSVAGAVGLVVLVLLTGQLPGSPALLIVVAGLTGLLLPQVGPLARVRWRPITEGSDQPGPTGAVSQQRRLVDAAFSYEGAADEASFVLGPALVGVLAVVVSPAGALVTAAVLLAIFGSAFALHRTADFRVPEVGIGGRGRLVTGAFVVLLLAQAAMGMLFGSVQTGTTVLATQAGSPGVAGLIHAVLGIGSVLAGLATVFLPERIGHERRWLVAALALALLATPLLAVDTLGMLIVVILALGFAVAPYMIAIFTLGERIAPPARVGAALTLLAAATGVGYAAGSSVAGRLSDSHGHHAAFAVTVTVTGLAALLAVVGHRLVARAVASAGAAAREPTVGVAAASGAGGGM